MADRQITYTKAHERIASLDFLRGVAILGILFINVENFAYPDSWSPYKYGFESAVDHDVRFWVYFLTQGKFYSMFALLFGVGFYLFLERLERKGIGLQAMDIYARRLLWLFVIGVLHAYLVWDGDVLYHYAICGFLLFPFRSMKTARLLGVIALLCVLVLQGAYLQVEKRQDWKAAYAEAMVVPEEARSEKEQKSIGFWEKRSGPGSRDTATVAPRKETYLIGLQESYEHIGVLKGTLYYRSLLFRSLLLMLLGIVLYRAGIFADYRVWRHYSLLTLLLLAAGLTVNYIRYYHWTYTYYPPVTSLWQEWLFTFPKELLGFAYVLLLNGLYQKYLHRIRWKAISAVGRMALSNYLFQNVVLGLLFYGYGLGLYNQFARRDLLWVVLLLWVVQLVLSSLYLRKFAQGPVEMLWKRLTYGSLKQ